VKSELKDLGMITDIYYKLKNVRIVLWV